MFFYLSWKPGEGLAQAIEQLFPECVGKSTKLGRLGRCCLERGGGMKVGPSQTTAQREREAPWHSEQSWGLMGGAIPVPSQRQDRKGVSCPHMASFTHHSSPVK